MSSQFWPIVMNLLAAVFGAVGQYLYKIGSKQLGKVALWQNWQLYTGMATFCVVMVLFIISFRMGGRLSVVYPVYATTFIWALLIAIFAEHEPYNTVQFAGVFVIILGVSLIAIGSPK